MASLGEQLRHARESGNISLDVAARELKISKRYLEALEDNNYGAFPAPIYIRGFLRNYSKFLGLEPGAVLEQYGKLVLPKSETIQSAAPVKRTEHRIMRKRVIMLLSALAVAIICLVALYFLRNSM